MKSPATVKDLKKIPKSSAISPYYNPRERSQSDLVLSTSKAEQVSPSRSLGNHSQKQASLHSFFGGHDPTIPDIFHLYYDIKRGTLTASFYRHKKQPVYQHESIEIIQKDASSTISQVGDDVMWTSSVYIRSLRKTITITTNLPCASSCSSSDNDPVDDSVKNEQWTNIPLLKSHLQKCVRRGLAKLAISTSHELMKLSFTDFIRRVSVVLIEDAHFTTFYPVLIWVLLADSKGYQAGVLLRQHLLGIVGCIARLPHQDVELFTENDNHKLTRCVSEIFRSLEQSTMTRLVKDCLWSLSIRRAFGGMTCDMKLLDAVMVTLYNRCQAKSPSTLSQLIVMLSPSYTLVSIAIPAEFGFQTATIHSEANSQIHSSNETVEWVSPLNVSEFVLAAVDFHVNPRILQQLQSIMQGRGQSIDESRLRKLMWTYSSSVNVRQQVLIKVVSNDKESVDWCLQPSRDQLNERDHEQWNEIERDFMYLANRYVCDRR